MMTYAEIKSTALTLYGNYIGSGNFVESDAGSPSELAIILDLIHNRIMGAPKEWDFAKIIGSITSTGATTYNLEALLPDFLSAYQVYGISEHSEHTPLSNSEANITSIDGWTIRNRTLVFTGTIPSAGTTIKIQYKSQFMVESSLGVRKRYFTDDTDVSVLPIADTNMLIQGIGQHVNWKTDEVSRDKRDETKDLFREAWNNAYEREDQSRPLLSLL